jgi:hypothetical protein
MSTETNTVMVCDACGKREVNPTRPRGHVWPEPEEWRHFNAGYRSSYPGFSKSEFDVCSWACAKQIHAKLAEVTFDRKTAENEAACLQWAMERAGIKATELDAKTTECVNLLARVRVLESQLKQFGSFDALNAERNELIQRCFRLEEELANSRKLDREELASILRSAIRVPRTLRRRPQTR